MNTYGQTTIYNQGAPLYIVEIHSNILAAFSVFNTAEAAAEYIKNNAAVCKPDPAFMFSAGLIKAYQEGKQLFSKRSNRQIYINY